VKTPEILQRLSRSLAVQPTGWLNLMAREGGVKDIPAWYALHQSLGPPYPQESWRILPELWQTLLSTGRLLLFLVEDRARPVGSRIISCCAAVFAMDTFCAEAKSTLPPFLGVQLAQRYLSQQLPLLSRSEIAGANADEGLNLVVCFEGWDRTGLSHEQFLAVREKQCGAFHDALSGYHLKEFLANPMGKETLQEMLDAGAQIQRDYATYFRESDSAAEESSRPWLVGLTREEAQAHPGSYLASLFFSGRPRFHFSHAQQELLRHALIGETSDDLASSLSLSPWTVKKRWHAIYTRVARVDPELLPPTIGEGPTAHARGTERRRRLLNYLRQHPEELRPSRGRS